MLQLTEEPANSLIALGHANLEKFATLLKDFNLPEMGTQKMQDSEAIGLSAEVQEKVGQVHLSIRIEISFEFEVRA